MPNNYIYIFNLQSDVVQDPQTFLVAPTELEPQLPYSLFQFSTKEVRQDGHVLEHIGEAALW
jgi:hypothetical protein